MAKIPDFTALGGVPGLSGDRREGGYSVAPFAAGGQAIARGVEQLGSGIGEAGAGLGDYTLGKARYETAVAATQREAELTMLKAKLADPADQDYGSKVKRFGDQAAAINDKWAKTISLPALQDRFKTEGQTGIELANVAIANHARAGLNAQSNAYRTGDAENNVINAALLEDDGNARAAMLRAHGEAIREAGRAGMISPEEVNRERRTFGHKYYTAAYLKKADTDPGGTISELEGDPGAGPEVTNRILEIEGHDKARRSSADGYGQFIKSTWLESVRKYRPDLAEGRSDDEVLAMRADKGLGRDMTEKLRQENEAGLKAAGVSTEPGYQYLAHFLGLKGAVAIAQSSPDTPAVAALSKVVGSDQARRMVAANPTILSGSAGDVAQWAHGKMGSSEMSRFAREYLDPEVREQLLSRARANLQRQDGKEEADFQLRFKDTVSQAMDGIEPVRPLTEGDFIAKRGPVAGPQLYRDYAAQLQTGKDLVQIATMSPDDVAKLREKYQPKPGDGYAAGVERQAAVEKAIGMVAKEKADDPALFSLRRLPDVKDSWDKFQAVSNDAGASAEQRAIAARQFVTQTRLAQAKAGVAPEDIRALPKGYADRIAAEIAKPAAAGGADLVNARIKAQAEMWGDAWPEVVAGLKSAGPLVTVLGAGVKDAAGQRLVDSARTPFAEVVKDEHSAKAIDIRTGVEDAMAPFARSLLGNAGAVGLYGDVRSQAEKLAALYVFQDGMGGPAAAKQAVDDVLNFKYEYRDGFRIPAKQHRSPVPYPADDMQAAAAFAKRHLGETVAGVDLSVKPAIDSFGGAYTADQIKTETTNAKRDGAWTTAPREQGVALTYGGRGVRRPDGKDFILTWDQLAALKKASEVETGYQGGPAFVDVHGERRPLGSDGQVQAPKGNYDRWNQLEGNASSNVEDRRGETSPGHEDETHLQFLKQMDAIDSGLAGLRSLPRSDLEKQSGFADIEAAVARAKQLSLDVVRNHQSKKQTRR